jgi:hypothetical protein
MLHLRVLCLICFHSSNGIQGLVYVICNHPLFKIFFFLGQKQSLIGAKDLVGEIADERFDGLSLVWRGSGK